MNKSSLNPIFGIAVFMMLMVFLYPADLAGKNPFQIELYGGISYFNPKDLNLISAAEEQYNDFYFIQRQLYKQGYFINDFPKIRFMLPVGLRVRYAISPALSLSVSAEQFSHHKEKSIQGTFSYVQPDWSDTQTKTYDPFSLELSGYSVLGGFLYKIPVGNRTDLEVGAGAGWSEAQFAFSSTWSHSVHFEEAGGWELDSMDGGTLEGDGSGSGFTAQVNLRLNQVLGQRLGFFIEAAGTYCRMKSITGEGRETRLGIPGESSWEGTWGIKKEEIYLYLESTTISAPTNYWEGWTESQRDRDFVLDLSRLQLAVGVYLKF